MNNSTLWLCAPGSGKSEAMVNAAVPQIGKKAIFMADQQKSSSIKFLKYVAASDYPLVLVDDIDRLDRVLQLQLVGVSRANESFVRDRENAQHFDRFAEIIQGDEKLTDMPLKYAHIKNAVTAYQQLPQSVRQHYGVHAIVAWLQQRSFIKTRLLQYLLASELKRRLQMIDTLHPATYLREIDAAYRMLERHLLCPAVAGRVGSSTLDLEQFIQNDGIMVVHGGTLEEFRMVAGIRAQQWIQTYK